MRGCEPDASPWQRRVRGVRRRAFEARCFQVPGEGGESTALVWAYLKRAGGA